MSDFISEDTKIDKGGAVTGTLHYVTEVTAFGEGENEGHYLPLMLDSVYEGKEITVKRNGTVRANKVADTEWLLYVPDTDATFTFETDEDDVFLTLSFSGVTLEEQ